MIILDARKWPGDAVWVGSSRRGVPEFMRTRQAHMLRVSRRIATLSYVSDTVYAGEQYFGVMWGG